MATAHPVTYWDCKECPLKEECNEKNFRGWKPWGPTEQAARDIVLEHLMNCGLHKIEGLDRGDEFTALANECVIDEVPWVERRSKRGRTSGWDGPEFSEAACPPRGAASAFKTVIELAQSAVDAGLAGPRPGKRAIGAPLPEGPSPSAAPSRSSAVAVRRQMVTNVEIREVVDSLGRCITSARHAQKLSSMAARAFEDEAAIFEEVRDNLKHKIEKWDRDH